MPGVPHHGGSGHYRFRMVDIARREGGNHRSKGRETSVVCDVCGSRAPGDDDVPLTWVVSVEGGVARAYCERCAREHLRSIEAKLDSRWW